MHRCTYLQKLQKKIGIFLINQTHTHTTKMKRIHQATTYEIIMIYYELWRRYYGNSVDGISCLNISWQMINVTLLGTQRIECLQGTNVNPGGKNRRTILSQNAEPLMQSASVREIQNLKWAIEKWDRIVSLLCQILTDTYTSKSGPYLMSQEIKVESGQLSYQSIELIQA
jgi:hypothetical protein